MTANDALPVLLMCSIIILMVIIQATLGRRWRKPWQNVYSFVTALAPFAFIAIWLDMPMKEQVWILGLGSVCAVFIVIKINLIFRK